MIRIQNLGTCAGATALALAIYGGPADNGPGSRMAQ